MKLIFYFLLCLPLLRLISFQCNMWKFANFRGILGPLQFLPLLQSIMFIYWHSASIDDTTHTCIHTGTDTYTHAHTTYGYLHTWLTRLRLTPNACFCKASPYLRKSCSFFYYNNLMHTLCILLKFLSFCNFTIITILWTYRNWAFSAHA